MASLGELFIQLAFEGDTKGAEEFRQSLKEVENSAQLMIKTMKELTKAVNKLVETELKRMSETTDEATKSSENNSETTIENTETKQENTEAVVENTQATEENTNVTQENSNAQEENSTSEEKNTKTKQNAIKILRRYALAISGAIYAIHRLTDSLLKENQQWLNLTRTSDIALETFQKWNSIGKTLGIDNAADQIKNLNDRLFEMRLTGQGARGFILAGINPTNAEDVMEQLRNRVAGLDDTSASYILKQMGLDPSMLHILRMSREEFASINAELSKYRLTPQQRRDLQMFNLQIQIAAQKLQYLKQKAILAIMPAWTKFMQSLARVTEGVSWFVGRLNDALNLFPPVVSGILKVSAAVGVLWKAMQLLKLDPIYLLISAIVGALYLIIDDIVTYFQGGESTIGLLLGAFDELDNKINFETPQWIKDLLYLVQNIDNIVGAVKDIKDGNVEVKTKDIFGKLALDSIFGSIAMPVPLPNSVIRTINNSTNNTNNTNNTTKNNNITINSNQPVDYNMVMNAVR